MTGDVPSRNTAATRRLLAAAFDDPGLDAFCMDHYPQVYDQFSQGMHRDEKIALLLDPVRRLSYPLSDPRRSPAAQ